MEGFVIEPRNEMPRDAQTRASQPASQSATLPSGIRDGRMVEMK